MFGRVLIAAGCLAVLVGCSYTGGSVSHLQVDIRDDEALVMVAVAGDEPVSSLHDRKGVYHLWPPHNQNGFNLIRVPVGHEFAISKIYLSTATTTTYRTAVIKESKRLLIDKHGIYCYGSLVIEDGRVRASYEISRAMVEDAEAQHPYYFARLARINC